jgi:hypothetical protein
LELEAQWRAFAFAAQSLVFEAKQAEPHIGEVVVVDATHYISPSRLEHCCRDADARHGRYVLETQGVLLGESQLELSAIAGMTGAAASRAEALLHLAQERRIFGFESALARLLR